MEIKSKIDTPMMSETVFSVGAEGGSLSIGRITSENRVQFIYRHKEFDPLGDDFVISKTYEYETFEEPFQLINSKYSWFLLYYETIHEDYRDYVSEELVKALNLRKIDPMMIDRMSRLEESLCVKLKYSRSNGGWRYKKLK